MLDHTTNPNLRKTPRDLLLRVLSAIGSKIFQTEDRRARDHGWQITPRQGGLGRTYRDPRFDSLTSCPACNGRGRMPDRTTCPGCQGTGRTVLGLANTTQSGQRRQARGVRI
jgi:hypothetical protein